MFMTTKRGERLMDYNCCYIQLRIQTGLDSTGLLTEQEGSVFSIIFNFGCLLLSLIIYVMDFY